ncbi:pantoate--beta-alanine ligase [Aurantimonas sp. Leaf443]|uniref:pantoate--beta-alanine ligase n=1 Tax=Aurantimonas sp. Leaf443 TaxID=1736378 RepID=UPI0006FAA40E|nr:pantoate--beta-alanine ligase [Aurantimonas sp. Leaf443]KQT87963.1 pantoate--beta-alanine ligase [Aurantimonas sp. Leaf443]
MDVFESIAELRAALSPERRAGRSIGLVPTMGYLHAGHMALVDRARAACDRVVVSIFVNPTQFGPNEDLATYPRDLPADLDLCRAHGVDAVFAPDVSAMYQTPIETHVEVASLSDILIGRHRPGHFRGVATVVAKLLNIVQPDRAFFGEKDFQQLAIVRRMVADLSFDVEIVSVPTVREADGLAASSRNAKLTPQDRAAAVAIPQALALAQARVAAGERDAGRLVQAMKAHLAREPRCRLQSLDICDAASLAPVETLGKRPAVILVTAHFGAVLLIDQREIAAPVESPA